MEPWAKTIIFQESSTFICFFKMEGIFSVITLIKWVFLSLSVSTSYTQDIIKVIGL